MAQKNGWKEELSTPIFFAAEADYGEWGTRRAADPPRPPIHGSGMGFCLFGHSAGQRGRGGVMTTRLIRFNGSPPIPELFDLRRREHPGGKPG